MEQHLEVRKSAPYWIIIHISSQQQVKTAESFRYGCGAKAGFFNRKRDALAAVELLYKTPLDWSQSADYFVGKRSIVQAVFDRIC